MEKNEIKKALYKQKPMAKYTFKEVNDILYKTKILVDGVEGEIWFKIPDKEFFDVDGYEVFKDEEPAQLLIRWLMV